jgi:beta-lactamase regulating signal transducer with metallopeptidase domain
MAAELLWRSAIAVVPLALLVAAICRWGRCRPATRHTLWLCVMASLAVGMVLPPISLPEPGAISPQPTALPPCSGETPDALSDAPNSSSLPAESAQDEPAHATRGAVHCRRECAPIPKATKPPREAPPRVCLLDLPDQSGDTTAASRDPSRAADVSPLPPRTVALAEPLPITPLTPVVGSAGPLSASGSTTLDVVDAPETSSSEEALPSSNVPDLASLEEAPPPPAFALPERTVATPSSTATEASPALPPPAHRRLLSAASAQADRWIAGLLSVRDAFGRLPVLPPSVWACGLLVVIAFRVSRIIVFRNRLRAAVPAPASVTRLVAEAAGDLGLRDVPRTLMVRDRISPMIWCSSGAQLILPADLWAELDDTGRRAVVYHELAHVKRRDHWVCWIESVVGAVYWWHPIVWWVRSRLQSEADHCCDAWVTWLMPRGRRAYAEVLLHTQQYISDSPSAALPPAAIGAIRGPARIFARRLTMVMTERMRPTLSVTSIGLAVAMLAAGWMATPARSAEPDKQQTENMVTIAVKSGDDKCPGGTAKTCPTHAPAASTCVTTCSTPPQIVPSVACTALSTSVACTADDPKRRKNDRDLEKRIERLERQLTKLAEKIERSHGYAHGPLPQPRGPKPSTEPLPPVAPEPPEAWTPPQFFTSTWGTQEIVRAYKVPEGRLQALGELMARDDVPTRVRILDDGIEVHGTAADHAVFKAFVDIISSDGEKKTPYRLSEGKLKALTELMVRDDVPVFVSTGEDKIVVHGSPAVQAVFKAFVDMIEPGKKDKGRRVAAGNWTDAQGYGGKGVESYKRFLTESTAKTKARAKAQQRAAEHQALAAQAQFQAQARAWGRAGSSRFLAKSLKYRQQMQKFLQAARTLERKAEAIEEKANQLEDQADQMRDQADDLRERALETDSRREAVELREKAEQLEDAAEDMQQKAEELFEEAEDVEREAEELEARAEEVEEQLDELEEEAEHEDQDYDEDDDDDDDDEDDEEDLVEIGEA